MAKIIECVPNISEGKDIEKIQTIINSIKETGVKILDYSSDQNHNRTVITFIGDEKTVIDGAFITAKKAVELIDLTKHKGEHPRMGAVDVIPLIPVLNTTIKECVEMSKTLSKKIADELNLPVYLYSESAIKDIRRKLPNIREGEFEGFFEKIKDPLWKPDFGPQEVHKTAGVVAIGARNFLIAFNINLQTSDVKIANKIAKSIRESSGGLMNLQAKGMLLQDRNIAQVSMNILNYETTPIYRVFEIVKMEALRYGVDILESELVGLAPTKVFLDAAAFYLRLPKLSKDSLIETKIYEGGED